MQTGVPILIFGEVLFDCFPDGTEVLGGAPFNVAWHLRGFGLSPLLISRVGRDDRGQRIRSAMQRWGLDRAWLQEDPSHPTGRVSVTIEDDEPHYDIVMSSAFDCIQPPDVWTLPANGFLYHGTLALRHGPSAAALASLKSSHRGPIFLDVNLRSPWWSTGAILSLVDDADHVKLNQDELALLSPDGPVEGDAASLVASIRKFAERHRLESLILTRGAQGALLCRGGEISPVGPAPGTHVVDTVGAGDAFAATILLGLSQRWPWADCLSRARDFSAALVSRRGATIDDPSVYARFLASWGFT